MWPFETMVFFQRVNAGRFLPPAKNVNTKIAREYLSREDRRLFYKQPPDPDEPWEQYQGLSQEEEEPIVNFIFETPQLTIRLYQALTKAVSDEPYLQKAKEILFPSLSNVIPRYDRQFPAKKNDLEKLGRQKSEMIE